MTVSDKAWLDELFSSREQETLLALLHRRFHDDAKMWMEAIVREKERADVATAILADPLFEEMAQKLEDLFVDRAIEMPDYELVEALKTRVYEDYSENIERQEDRER